MKEQKALAYVNMYGILGSIEDLCRIDSEASAALSGLKKPVSLCFEVKDGPCRTFNFSKNGCKITEGDFGCSCKMRFASPEKFNRFIDFSKPGLPIKKPIKTFSFLLGPFTAITNRLNTLLRPDPKALEDSAFFEENTVMTLYVIAGAISALANNDSISKVSAAHTPNGDALLGIKDGVHITIRIKDGVFTTIKEKTDSPRAVMEFSDIELANGLFAGKVSTINEMCKGNIRLAGMLSIMDNINRILDRVSVYLA